MSVSDKPKYCSTCGCELGVCRHFPGCKSLEAIDERAKIGWHGADVDIPQHDFYALMARARTFERIRKLCKKYNIPPDKYFGQAVADIVIEYEKEHGK